MALVGLYACFGSTVMMHYTGYMKAAGLFFLIVPFLWETLRPATRWVAWAFLMAVDIYFAVYLYQDRIAPIGVDYDRYLQRSKVTEKAPIACLKSFDARIRLVGMEDLDKRTLIKLPGDIRASIFHVEVTDTGAEPFRSTSAVGSVHISYHWLSEDGKTVVKDGIRTSLPDSIPPGGSKQVPVVVEYPAEPGHYILRLTPVQEGCAWFYNANPTSKLDIDYVVH